MAGFSKVFSTIWGGSLYGHFEASAVFLVFLSLADRDGAVDMTPEAIAGTTGWPLNFILKGIRELEKPDAKSRTPGHEGRRILLMDDHRPWGWIITNYSLYRDKMRSAERTAYLAEKQREYRARNKSTSVNTSTSINQDKPIAEADAAPEAESEAKNKNAGAMFEEFWKAFGEAGGKKTGRGQAEKAWKKVDPFFYPLILQALLAQKSEHESFAAVGQFHAAWKAPATWLNAKCWEDEIRKPDPKKIKPVYTHETDSNVILAACKTRGIDTVGKTRQQLLSKLNAGDM